MERKEKGRAGKWRAASVGPRSRTDARKAGTELQHLDCGFARPFERRAYFTVKTRPSLSEAKSVRPSVRPSGPSTVTYPPRATQPRTARWRADRRSLACSPYSSRWRKQNHNRRRNGGGREGERRRRRRRKTTSSPPPSPSASVRPSVRLPSDVLRCGVFIHQFMLGSADDRPLTNSRFAYQHRISTGPIEVKGNVR